MSITTPVAPLLNVAPSQRVMVAGFITGGTTEIDVNAESVHLLRSRLRSKTSLTVLESRAVALPRAGAQEVVKKEEDLQEGVFSDVPFWKRIGDEYQDSLIVTGSVFFTVKPNGWWLKSHFIVIDGRTGLIVHSARFTEQTPHRKRLPPALAAYFLLMDRIMPRFLQILSEQKLPGTRTLLR